jgi:dnd system-associated protein 4
VSVRRPPKYEHVLQALISEGAPFQTMRDALIFAAVLGFHHGLDEEFEGNQGSIDLQVMAGNIEFESVLLMLTAASAADSPELLGEEYLRDRLTTFEQFAAGGLGYIERRGRELQCLTIEVVPMLIAERLRELDEEG